MSLNHMMIDLETMGTTPDSVVLSCGAVMFDPESGVVMDKLSKHWVLQIQNQLDAGRVISGDTLKWWIGQSDEAIRSWNKGEGSCANLVEFRENMDTYWCRSKAKYVWSHGSIFDVAILENMMEGQTPWKFWDIRDTRTLLHAAGIDQGLRDYRDKSSHHNAEADAIAQATAICDAWKKVTV